MRGDARRVYPGGQQWCRCEDMLEAGGARYSLPCGVRYSLPCGVGVGTCWKQEAPSYRHLPCAMHHVLCAMRLAPCVMYSCAMRHVVLCSF